MKALLVGPIQQENLALGYLASYGRARGHEVVVVPYRDRIELEMTATRILEERPDLVGLGIAFQNRIDEYLALLAELRARGYGGHLTCGGHVGTFCWEELMRDVTGLDTVVRHDGEETLVEMLDKMARGESVRDIAGLVWREGDRVVKGPVRVAKAGLDELPWPARSSEQYVVGGVVVDFLITARGCVGECNYCSIAAYTSEQRKSYRLRAPEAVADEIAYAYHERHARVFFVQDDLFVLPSERQAIARMEKIQGGIRARGVHDVVFWVKGRPESITPAVARATRDMGGIHMFLGVENASEKRLSYLGRLHLPVHNESALENLRAANVTPSFNFMLFDPDCSLDDVETTVDMAARNVDLPWNVCRTENYSGTALRERLAAENRLEGDWRSWGYHMRDERAEVMFRVMRVSFHERAFAIDSLLNRLISVSFARQIHDELLPSDEARELSAAVDRVGERVRRDSVERMRELLALVRSASFRDKKGMRRFAVDQALAIGTHDMPLRAEVASLWNRYHALGRALAERPATRTGRNGYGIAAGS
jgi:anaerobic magnesium-protoporphyrin IX monomethyl ester cyclase